MQDGDLVVLFNMFKLTLHDTMTVLLDKYLALLVQEIIADVDLQSYFTVLSTITGTTKIEGMRVNYSTSKTFTYPSSLYGLNNLPLANILNGIFC